MNVKMSSPHLLWSSARTRRDKRTFWVQLKHKTVGFTTMHTFLPSEYNFFLFKSFLEFLASVINVAVTTDHISQHMMTISSPQK